jgi:hypothetical protein
LPSGTAFKQAAIIQSEADGNLNLMLENKGLHLERMFREHITPYVIGKLNNAEEIVTTLDAYGIDKIDKKFISSKAAELFNRKVIDAILRDDYSNMPNLQEEEVSVREDLSELGGTRFLKPSEIPTRTWKDIMKDFEANIVYEITGENEEKQAVLDTLSSVFNTIVAMGGRPMSKEETTVFNKILDQTRALSPLEISLLASEQQARQLVPRGGQVGAGIQLNAQQQNNESI